MLYIVKGEEGEGLGLVELVMHGDTNKQLNTAKTAKQHNDHSITYMAYRTPPPHQKPAKPYGGGYEIPCHTTAA